MQRRYGKTDPRAMRNCIAGTRNVMNSKPLEQSALSQRAIDIPNPDAVAPTAAVGLSDNLTAVPGHLQTRSRLSEGACACHRAVILPGTASIRASGADAEAPRAAPQRRYGHLRAGAESTSACCRPVASLARGWGPVHGPAQARVRGPTRRPTTFPLVEDHGDQYTDLLTWLPPEPLHFSLPRVPCAHGQPTQASPGGSGNGRCRKTCGRFRFTATSDRRRERHHP